MLRRFGFDVMLEGEGGGGGAPAPAPVADPPAPVVAPAPVPAPAAMDQAELTRRMTAEKEQGRRAAEQAAADALGMSVDDAVKFIADKKAADTAALSEADRKLAEAAAETTKANTSAAAAQLVARDARVVIALTAEGVIPELDPVTGELTGRAARIVKLLDLANDANAATIKAALDALKTDEPTLFTAAAPAPAPSGDLRGSPPANPAAEDALTRGAKLAATVNEGNMPVFDPANPFAKAPATAP